MDLLNLILLSVIGIFASWLNVMAGGGSLLTIPAMLFMDIPAPVANGTNRIGILWQNIFAVLSFFKKGFINIKLSMTLALCASIGAFYGASIGVHLDGVWFNYLLSVIMIVVMFVTIFDKNIKPVDNKTPPKNLLIGHIAMIGAGFWGGFIQVGVGFILMPILNRIMGLSLTITNMHKVTVVLIYTLVALFVFASQVEILYSAGIALAIGASIGGYLGAHTSVVKGDVWIRRVLFIVLSVFIIKLLLF